MQIAKSNLLWRDEAFDSNHGGKDMQMRQMNVFPILCKEKSIEIDGKQIIYSLRIYFQGLKCI